MPQPFNEAVITNGGAQLLTRAQAGEIKIQFTRIVTGNGTYTPEEKTLSMLQKCSALKAQKNSYGLSEINVFSDHSVKVTALITNQDAVTGETLVDAGYFINEMGLYAKEKDGNDDTEVLYSITVTAGENGDFLPPYNGYNPAQIIQEYYATVDNSADVTIQTINPAVALAEDVLALWQRINNLFHYDAAKEALTISGEAFSSSAGSVTENYSYALPIATKNRLGGVKVGQGIDVAADGTISADIHTSAEKAAALIEANTEGFSDEEIKALF